MKPQSRKAKGRNHQKAVAAMITQVFDLEEGDVKWTSMGAPGIDIQLSPKARKVCPLAVECKKQRKHPGVAEMGQARYNRDKYFPQGLAVVAWSPHGSGPEDAMVTFNMREFLTFLRCVSDEKK